MPPSPVPAALSSPRGGGLSPRAHPPEKSLLEGGAGVQAVRCGSSAGLPRQQRRFPADSSLAGCRSGFAGPSQLLPAVTVPMLSLSSAMSLVSGGLCSAGACGNPVPLQRSRARPGGFCLGIARRLRRSCIDLDYRFETVRLVLCFSWRRAGCNYKQMQVKSIILGRNKPADLDVSCKFLRVITLIVLLKEIFKYLELM